MGDATASSSGRCIDLRSDTVTRPGPGMLQAMMSAAVGDDVWGDDPTVNRLQQEAADMFGHEAGLFCPSGTMTNQIAIKCHTQPGDELICADNAHIYMYEGVGRQGAWVGAPSEPPPEAYGPGTLRRGHECAHAHVCMRPLQPPRLMMLAW